MTKATAPFSERADEGYASYLGHCFPATDIPSQARELYLLNHIRLIPDANYQPIGTGGIFSFDRAFTRSNYLAQDSLSGNAATLAGTVRRMAEAWRLATCSSPSRCCTCCSPAW